MIKDRNNTVEQHPEDRAAVVEGKEYARQHGAAFCAANKERLAALITEYGDGHAETALSRLREEFWSGVWEKSEKAARQG